MNNKKYIVRLYDGFDNEWIDISKPISLEEAEEIWNKKTQGGMKNINYNDIDYYQIFPANTRMLFSESSNHMS